MASDDNYWMRMGAGRTSRRQVLRGAALGGAGLAAAALIGCGSDEATPKAATPAGKTSQAAPGATGKAGGRLALILENDSPTFDPHGAPVAVASMPAYNQLVQNDPMVVPRKPGGIIPDLAKSWETAPDGMKYTFQLVPNAKFHDGTPMTSADVKASLERIKTPPSGVVSLRKAQFEPVKAFETPDANTLVISLSRPMPASTLLPVLGQGYMTIFSKKDIDGGFDFSKKVNGTGPYRLNKYELGNRVILDKNKEYHVKDRPYLDGIDMYVIPDRSTRVANFQSGNIDISLGLYQAEQASLKQALGDKAVYTDAPALIFDHISMNSKRAPWSDLRVRLAASLTMSRPDARKVLEGGSGVPGGYMLPKGGWAIDQADIEKINGYQPYSDAMLAEAKKLIAAAGVPAGFTFKMLTKDSTNNVETALFVQDQLKKLGWNPQQEIVNSATMYAGLDARNYEMNTIGHGFPLDDPDAMFASYYLKEAALNYTGAWSQPIEDAFVKQSSELNAERRVAMVKDLQKLAMPEFAKVILFWRQQHGAHKKDVKNFAFGAPNSIYQDVWLDR